MAAGSEASIARNQQWTLKSRNPGHAFCRRNRMNRKMMGTTRAIPMGITTLLFVHLLRLYLKDQIIVRCHRWSNFSTTDAYLFHQRVHHGQTIWHYIRRYGMQQNIQIICYITITPLHLPEESHDYFARV